MSSLPFSLRATGRYIGPPNGVNPFAASLPLQSAQSWAMPTLPRPTKIAFGEMRDSGLRRVLVYCGDYNCAHHIEINADRWPDDVRLSDLEPLFDHSRAPGGERPGRDGLETAL